MPHHEDLITFTDAAEEKSCGRNTLYRHANAGELNTVKVGDRKLLVKDEKYEQFEPKETGARMHRDKRDDSE